MKRAKKCESCKYHHKDEAAEDGWYCGKYVRWICSKSDTYKDYSIARKERGK
jgi:hypothetical protein